MKLPDLKKTKLSTVSTFGVVSILATAMIIIAIVAIAAIRGAGLYSLKTTKAAIKEEAVKLLQENTKRKAIEYSEYFTQCLFFADIIGDLASINYGKNKKFNIPDSTIDNYFKKFKKSKKNMPYVYNDNNYKVLTTFAGNNEMRNKKKLYFISLLHPVLYESLKVNKGYYQTWIWDYENYIQTGCTEFQKDKLIIPNINDCIKFVREAYLGLTKRIKKLSTGGIYKDIYGPLVISSTKLEFTNKFKLGAGIDFKFEELVKEVLQHNIPFITEENIIDDTSNSFIISSLDGSVLAMAPSLRDSLKIPMEDIDNSLLRYSLDVKLSSSKIEKIRDLTKIIKKKNTITLKIDNKEYIFCFHKMSINDWVFGVAVPTKDLYKAVEETEARMGVTVSGFIVNFLMVAVFFMFILLIVVVLFFKTYLVKPIVSFRDSVLKMGQGDLETPIKEKGVYEIAVLANSFNDLRVDLKDHMENFKLETVERQRRENELKTARQVQLSVLPMITSLFKNRGIQLYAKLLPAIDVAGDYYDFFYTDKNKLVLIIADVSGKGISASFYMAVTKRTLRNTCISEPDDPAKSINLANKILCSYNINMFVTLFLVYYDMETGEMKYANGGHNEAVCLKANGTVDVFGCLNNAALGCFAELPFTKDSYKLEKGDTLYVYTDGIVEANKGDENFYGLEKFTDLLVKNKNLTIGKICKTVIQDVHEFEEGGQFDDITILAIKRD